jgi:hypothetical protein
MIRFRSFKFYTYVNTSIQNGGLYGDSKFKIYSLLPDGTYPITLLILEGQLYDFQLIINQNNLRFPLIVKPDIGLRGIDVDVVYNIEQIEEYRRKKKIDFLIQEKVEYPNEIGLFYYRLPRESIGEITGITIKKFLSVKGNGIDTIEALLRQTPRYFFQIRKLKKMIDLNKVLPDGEELCLVPFGNHNRGTAFFDGKKYINSHVHQTFNELLLNVEGFFYGRLDIRFSSWEELEQGKRFSIIELNGAKSEPTHIYDPKHSFWSGQKEIFRHQKILAQIVKLRIRSKA